MTDALEALVKIFGIVALSYGLLFAVEWWRKRTIRLVSRQEPSPEAPAYRKMNIVVTDMVVDGRPVGEFKANLYFTEHRGAANDDG